MFRSSIRHLLFATVASVGVVAVASAQTYAPQPQANINPTDVIADTVAGAQAAQSTFVTPTMISGAPGYIKAVPTTGFVYTFGKAQLYLLLNPAATLAAGGAVTEANPSDGQRECIRSTQNVTAFTYTANPAAQQSQTITGGPTALAAGTALCFTYSKSNATWDPS